ncbi:VOC family protein [Nocardioides litoris]|uniref:VOC family protein n=1 Tax=Nocardioides litoris TaxID=1926648 RepID=UPI001FE8D614|nr:VOC family protein [Nocardioides litoris]
MSGHPVVLHTALDARDCRGLAKFYRQLLGVHYRPGDEDPSPDADWLVLVDDHGARVLAVQRKDDTRPPTWPSEEVPMQAHLDLRVDSVAELERHRARAEALGARAPARPVRRRRRAPLRARRPRRTPVLPARAAGMTSPRPGLRAGPPSAPA